MNKIYKYNLQVGISTINLPKNSKILHFNNQHNFPVIWCSVPSEEKSTEKRIFHMAVTGGFEPENSQYIGTVLFEDGAFVAHLYEILQ